MIVVDVSCSNRGASFVSVWNEEANCWAEDVGEGQDLTSSLRAGFLTMESGAADDGDVSGTQRHPPEVVEELVSGLIHRVTKRDAPSDEANGVPGTIRVNCFAVDEPNFPLHLAFRFTTALIAASLKLDNLQVVIHCQAGRSRSAAAVAAYMMFDAQQRRLSASAHAATGSLGAPASNEASESVRLAVGLIASRRPVVQPNPGFIAQLESWWGTLLEGQPLASATTAT